MGANRKLATPDLYPAIFHAVVRNGLGVIYSGDTPWSSISCAKRFRLFLSLLRSTPSHPLYGAAKARWSVRIHKGGLEIAIIPPGKSAMSSALHGMLVSRGLGGTGPDGGGSSPGAVVNGGRMK